MTENFAKQGVKTVLPRKTTSWSIFQNLPTLEIRKSGGEHFMAKSFSPNLVALGM